MTMRVTNTMLCMEQTNVQKKKQQKKTATHTHTPLVDERGQRKKAELFQKLQYLK